jgi:2-oxoglutarate ferredoxin oxidoreductase subunit gamma
LAGQILGRAAVYSGKNAVQTQSYGAEARGSAAQSEVIISNEKIGFPAVTKCDILIAMSQTAVEKHLKDLKEDGLLLVDSTNVKEIPKIKANVYKIPATEMSERLFGKKIYANMIMLGAMTKISRILSKNIVKRAIKAAINEKTLSTNLEAYKKGTELNL